MEKNLTTGSVGRQLIGFSLPYLLSYLLQTLYGMADLFIIGQYEGVAGTAAVAVGAQVMHMLTVMIVGLAMGTTVSIARAIGADDRPQAAAATGNTVTLFLSLSLVLTVGLLLLRRPITAVMSTPEAAIEGTVRYLTICFPGIPCITAYNILSAIFRGMGDSKSPMIFIFIACLANIALDYLFIGALHLGPAGAALGTSLSQAISVAISLAVIVRRRTMPPAKADLRPQKPVMDAILKIGVPISVQDGFIQISFIVITVIANRRGLTDAAAVGIVEKIIGFLILVPSSMLSAVSALGAQNLGAGKPDQAAVLAGGQYLRGYIWDSFFAGVQFSFSGYFCACGRSGLSFRHNFSVDRLRPHPRRVSHVPAVSADAAADGAGERRRLAVFHLRALDMPLPQIADFLQNRDVGRIEEKLRQQKQELARIERKIDNRLRQLREAQTTQLDVIERVDCGPCRLFWLGQTLRITDCSQLELPTIQLAREQTEALIFLGKIGVSVSEEHLRAGDFSQYDGMFLASDGFSREITLIDYGLTNDTEKFVTEITIPVREA